MARFAKAVSVPLAAAERRGVGEQSADNILEPRLWRVAEPPGIGSVNWAHFRPAALIHSLKMIKAVIFDLGKVIVPFDFSRGYRAMAELCSYAPEEIPKRIGSTDLVARFESGQVSPEHFVEQLCQTLDIRMEYGHFCEIWSSIFLPHTLIPETLLEGLGRGYRLLLLSNTNAIHFKMVRENYPLLKHFDDYVLSYEVGAMKPSPVIYEEAIARAQCAPGECFFTDDIAEYVAAAREAGMDAVQFQSAAQIESELRDRGVSWE
jgi:FMN phosphatase YigB (HAD superfamily)